MSRASVGTALRRREVRRRRDQAARVDEVDGDVGPPRGVDDVPEAARLLIVDEALRHENQRLAPARRAERVERPLQHAHGDAVAAHGVRIHGRGAALDVGLHHADVAARLADPSACPRGRPGSSPARGPRRGRTRSAAARAPRPACPGRCGCAWPRSRSCARRRCRRCTCPRRRRAGPSAGGDRRRSARGTGRRRWSSRATRRPRSTPTSPETSGSPRALPRPAAASGSRRRRPGRRRGRRCGRQRRCSSRRGAGRPRPVGGRAARADAAGRTRREGGQLDGLELANLLRPCRLRAP